MNVGGSSRGHFDFINSMPWGDTAAIGLLHGMKAVGLAGFAHASNSPSLMKSARWQYCKALKEVNTALKSPVHVKKDSTLTSIMVLSIFETITGCNQKSLKAWSDHIQGASALLKLRGVEQVDTITGRRLFGQVASSLMICCLTRQLPLPSHIIEWSLAAKSKFETPDRALVAHGLMMDFTMLRASVLDGTLSEPLAVLSRALELDSELIVLFTTNLSDEWAYESIYTELTDDRIHNGYYHLYYDHWVAQVWNGMRSK